MSCRIAIVIALVTLSCAQCAHTPTPPQPVPDAAPTSDVSVSPEPQIDTTPAMDLSTFDPFAGQIFDCTGLDTTQAQVYASECADYSSMTLTNCLASAISQSGLSLGTIICGARDAEMAAFVIVDKGAATPAMQARANTLRQWFATEQPLLRSAP